MTRSFAAFPAARARFLDRRPDDILGEPAYRFWFLGDGEPRLCPENTGLPWDLEGNESTWRRSTRRKDASGRW